jgi:cytochrome c
MKSRIAVAAITGFAAIGIMLSAPRTQAVPQTSRSVWDGVFVKEQVKRGEALYARECASCHGADLTGGEEAPALAGPGFLANWEGLTMGDLAERVRVSMPPNSIGRLSRQHIVDILTHMLSFNSFPAGKAELDPKTEVLKQIRIESTKPKDKQVSN